MTFEYPPFIIGGAGIYAVNITRELAKLVDHMVVFCPLVDCFEETPKKYCNINNNINNIMIKEIKVDKRLPFKALQFWLRLPKAVKEVEKDSGKFDVIHFNSISYWFLKKKLSRAPHIITIHHLVADTIKSNKPSLISRIRDIGGENNIFLPFIEKRCIVCADKIIAVSEFTKTRIISNYKVPSKKIEVIYNGIDPTGYIFTKEELEQTKRQFNLDEKPVILFVGRVDDPRKGLDSLLKAFEKVLREIDAKLIVVGKGDQTEAKYLAKSLKILKNVVFTGFIDDITLKKYYVLSDVYVCPSRLEGFGLTILEAMAAGKPVIATDVGAIPEIIGEAGVLVEPENPEALARAIIDLLRDEQKMKMLQQKALSRAKKFSWEVAAKKVFETYRSLKEGFA